MKTIIENQATLHCRCHFLGWLSYISLELITIDGSKLWQCRNFLSHVIWGPMCSRIVGRAIKLTLWGEGLSSLGIEGEAIKLSFCSGVVRGTNKLTFWGRCILGL